MEGTKTEILEASGLSAIVEAFPGASQNEGLSIRENTEFDGDVLVSGLADGVATHMGLALQNTFLQSITYNSTKFVMLEVAQYAFDGLGGFSGGNTLGFSIAQLKEMIKDVLEKLDTILDEPGESSFIFMEKAYEALEHGYCKEALDHFKDVVRKAIQGFSYATKKRNPEAMVSVTRLMIIAEFSIATYNDQEQTFQTWKTLTEKQRVRIYSIIRANLDRLIKALKTLKAKGFIRQKTYDADNQDALDILLRQMVPILLDFEPNLSIANNPTGPAGAHKIVLHGTYIPQGISDAVQIGGDDTSLAIWKETERLYVFYNGHFYSDTIDDAKELEVTVDMGTHKVSMSGHCMKQENSENYVTKEVLKSIVKRDNKNMLAMMFKYFPNESLGRHCLVAACEHGSVGCVDAVMGNIKISPDDRVTYHGYSWSPLIIAAMNGKSAVIKQLINCYHADINHKDRYDYSALSLAIGCNWLDTVKLLLELGADRSNIQVTNTAWVKLGTMAGDASTGQGGRGEMEKYLKSQGIVYNQKNY